LRIDVRGVLWIGKSSRSKREFIIPRSSAINDQQGYPVRQAVIEIKK
jgi:hypothetical protein